MINRARKGKDMKIQFRLPGVSNRYQSGVVTTFTGVLVLVLLTLMMFFAIRVGVFEQRVSSNEMRQKLAFHAAESGIHHAKEYLRKNVALIASETNDLLPDGTDGWLSADGMRWRPCSEAPDSDLIDVDLAVPHKGSHPCYAETGVYDDDSLRRDTMFYYTNDPEAASETESTLYFPVDTAGLALPGTTEDVEVFALLCVLEVDEAAPPTEAPVKGCVTDLTDPDPDDSIVRDGTYFMVTFMARGQADCNGGTCNAEGAQPQFRRRGCADFRMDERQHQLFGGRYRYRSEQRVLVHLRNARMVWRGRASGRLHLPGHLHLHPRRVHQLHAWRRRYPGDRPGSGRGISL
jgi:hypothetical protein